MQALGAKMDFLNQRQNVIAQNVANSDTPGYRPKDLVDVDFSEMLKDKASGHTAHVSIATTDEQHLGNADATANVKSRKQKDTYEVAPSGNAVIMEEQLMHAGQNAMDYNLMVNIYQKQVNLFRIALGSGR
tara:strand:- start:18997 stop:19389 length:393 start_codon:yes stop_codon:yes gene_type:complete